MSVPVPSRELAADLSQAVGTPFWVDHEDRPAVRPALTGDVHTDLLVVGGGFTGLWAALLALEENPGRSVLLVDGQRIGWAASGRNGGFVAASLTHGLGNGQERWPDELATLTRLGIANLQGIAEAIAKYDIDCDFQYSGDLDVAVAPWQVDGLREEHELALSVGARSEFLDEEQTRAKTNSPSYLAGRYDPDVAMVNPARLVWGLAAVVERLGGTIAEGTPLRGLEEAGDAVIASTGQARITARQVILGTSVFPSPVRRIRPYVVPVWDHVLMTEPLTTEQLDAISWRGRHGIGDGGNLFHYYRLTDDNRLLFGGYDALYFFGNDLAAKRARNAQTERLLAQHLVDTFPILAGIGITHTWGGAIDTCSRFSAFWHLGMDKKVAGVQGFTGLGVGASRFGAQVCLDLLAGRDNERTRLEMVRKKPLPFPPEPIKWLGIQLTRRAIARADASGGRRGPWLKLLDKLGLGFDS
ncbi:MAG: NAD(P)/FAD-dependent oxidoreductase [Angustibacter sp.]